MKEYIEERAISVANYIIEHNATVRQTAKQLYASVTDLKKKGCGRKKKNYRYQGILTVFLIFLLQPLFFMSLFSWH